MIGKMVWSPERHEGTAATTSDVHFVFLSDDRYDVLCGHHAGGAHELRGGPPSHPAPRRGADVASGSQHFLYALLDDLWRGLCRLDRP